MGAPVSDSALLRQQLGFMCSDQDRTLSNDVEVVRLQTQRSLLSELLAQYAADGDESEGHASDDDFVNVHDDIDGAPSEPAPVARQDSSPLQRSHPISINMPLELSQCKAKDAYRRLTNAWRAEQLYLQQQQQQQYAAQLQRQQYVQQQQQQQNQRLQQNAQAAQRVVAQTQVRGAGGQQPY